MTQSHEYSNGIVNGAANGGTVRPVNGVANGGTVRPVNGAANGGAVRPVNGVANGGSNGGPVGSANGEVKGTIGYVSHSPGEAVPIAICGMGMRLPGNIDTGPQLWDLLVNKGDARKPVPEDRYNVDGFYSPHIKPGTVNMNHGYFLDTDLAKFDGSFFNMSQAELERLDPQQRLLLEVVWEAFENAGEVGTRGKDVGCFVGCFGQDWGDLHTIDTQDFPASYRINGDMDFVLANRISYEYDLRGPSLTVRTACSSAGVCLHLACQAIRQGDCSSAVVAGSSLILAPGLTAAMTEQAALSPDASCKSFDAAANGYARADAVNALFIKRLDDALRDGNPIRAIVRGSSSNCDGKTPGITNPSLEAHEALIRQAYRSAGLTECGQTAMVECHGTGTPVGDPLEVNAIANVFGDRGVYIGSVKPNIGHSEGASVISSIMKSVLALEHKQIPPNIKFCTPNPKIPFEEARLTVPVDVTPWPKDREERIGVNTFGIGGANVHIVLDSAESYGIQRPQPAEKMERDAGPQLLVFSAKHPDVLKSMVARYDDYIQQHPASLPDLAYTLAEHREHFPYRTFCVTSGGGSLVAAPSARCQSERRVLFVFTGQGAVWPRMGSELLATDPDFLADIREMDEVLASLEHAPDWKIEEELLKPKTSTQLGKAEYAQPICTAFQLALVNRLARFGIVPAAVVGHSSGEIAGAYAAGVLTMQEAMIAAFYRGFVARKLTRLGGMAAVGLGQAQVAEHLAAGVTVACVNSGSSVTLSGDEAALEAVLGSIRAAHPDVLARRLHVDKAYHSEHMADVGGLYHDLIECHLQPRHAAAPFYSSVTGTLLADAGEFGAAYWQRNLESPVLFLRAVEAFSDAADDEQWMQLEVGPHSALAGPLKQIGKERGAAAPAYACTQARGEPGGESFLRGIGQLHCAGVKVRFGGRGAVLHDLPPYAWKHDAGFWSESRVMKAWRFRRFLPHDLLGVRTPESNDMEPGWRNMLRLSEQPWLKDHCVGRDTVFPAAGYMAMAGEAARQMSGCADYTVRDMVIKTAMVLHGDAPTELSTTLRPHRLTVSADSSWLEFAIFSHNGAAWNKHCFGLVKGGPPPGSTPRPAATDTTPCARDVPAKRWYAALAKIGLNYGTAFSRLRDVTAGTTEPVAVATVTDHQEPAESPYTLHPITLDLVFQSLTVAAHHGQTRRLKTLCLPTFVGEMYVRGGTGREMRVRAGASFGRAGTGSGHAAGVADDGELAFSLRALKFRPLERDDAGDDGLSAVHFDWRPDVDLLDAKTLMVQKDDFSTVHARVEELFLLCAMDAQPQLEASRPAQAYLETYRAWMHRQLHAARTSGNALVPHAARLFKLGPGERAAAIRRLTEQLNEAGADAIARALVICSQHAHDIFQGRASSLDLLLEDRVLHRLYDWSGHLCDCGALFAALGHAKPDMSILEIGAGTGGLTARVLPHLQSRFGQRMFRRYTFTDISAGFFVQAKERFDEYAGVEYATLDISQDPLAQGYEAGQYDLVLASNVLHATPSLNTTLRNVRTLLSPRGRLFLQELCTESKWCNFVMGTLPDWWVGAPDGRPDEPYVKPERWDSELRAAGFAGIEAYTYDNPPPFHINANILARARIPPLASTRVSLLARDFDGGLVLDVERALRAHGYHVSRCVWGEQPPQDGGSLVAFMDLDRPFFDNVTDAELKTLLRVTEQLQSSTMLWLTRPAQVRCRDPRFAPAIGFARTVRSELAMAFATLELDGGGAAAADAVARVLEKLQRVDNSPTDYDADMEFSWSPDGFVRTPRCRWFSVPEALGHEASEAAARGLVVGRRGLLQTLGWVPRVLPALAPDEVRIKVESVGLNFKDIVIAMGIVDGEESQGNVLGCEGAGVVTATGSGATSLRPGDRVMFMGAYAGTLVTELQTLERMCVKMPARLGFEDAATMTCVYATVLRALQDKAGLRKGQSVLIHSATGGVGIAAIHVARWKQAEIYATVGNSDKARFLADTFGIPEDRIFNSRDASFADDVMAATAGRGVDVVLNSLSGELLHASWRCVAKNGTMLEIGKRDLAGRGALAMDAFEQNRSFVGIEMARLSVDDVESTTRLIHQTVELYEAGIIPPIHPITRFDAANIQEAFRFLQKGLHVGKVIVNMPADPTSLPLTPAPCEPSFRGDAAYLLVGGLGGLGVSIATWMVAAGARHLVFLSPSAGKSRKDQAFMEELAALGCYSQAFAADVSDVVAMRSALDGIEKPIAGVLQMALVLRDVGVLSLDAATWRAATLPKIQGTWNLHHLLEGRGDLDFFVLFSSLSGITGYWGQANYAAGNTFMDAFVQYRHSQGLPASVLDIGCVEDVGFISRNQSILETMKSTAGKTLSEQDLLDGLQLAMARSKPPSADAASQQSGEHYHNPGEIGIGFDCVIPISEPGNTVVWKRDPRMAAFRNLEKNSASQRGLESVDGVLRSFLTSMASTPQRLHDAASAEFLAGQIGTRVYTFLLRPEEEMDTSMTLSALGVDSLVGIELRNWWKQSLGVNVSVLEMLDGGSIAQLGQLAARKLYDKFTADEEQQPKTDESDRNYHANKMP